MANIYFLDKKQDRYLATSNSSLDEIPIAGSDEIVYVIDGYEVNQEIYEQVQEHINKMPW